MQSCISRFLFHYRITPHSVTGISPTQLLIGRRLRSKLDLFPIASQKVELYQQKQINPERPSRKFDVNDMVKCERFSHTFSWFGTRNRY